MARDALEDWKVGRKLKLAALDPAARPFASSSRERDDARLDELAVEIDRLQDLLYANGMSATGAAAGPAPKLLLVLQGMDTSGKDGTARAVFSRCSPLGVRVAAFKAPTEVERGHDFLWRVHAVAPRAGEVVVFNRSHYEDVLVPFVEGWIDASERDRRLAHIVAFERLLHDAGTRLVKCYLHISKDEQKARLQARVDDPAKRWKFNLGDLGTRAKWKHYLAAYETALAATSTPHAPWHVIPADSKGNRNLMIASLVARELKAMKLKPPKPDFDPAAVKIV
ncbi:MAG TPA: PPK2 family polyphosphate kinase [Methylibium sp.]|nr:PPK2 family polyphosphate kinase [Methylibium sp.]